MGIADDYLALMQTVGERIALPAVARVHIARPGGDPGKSCKFGALVLADEAVGLTYTNLDDSTTVLQDRELSEALIGGSPLEAARLYAGAEAWQRVLGLAAINAISQHLFRISGFTPPAGGRTLQHLALRAGDHVGMVGYFPPLVAQVRQRGLALTVVELDEQWLASAVPGVEVTLDPARLGQCNKVVCTGTVLVNQTLDELLGHCRQAEQLSIVGPTLGCLPDPLFARGVTHAGGTGVVDYPGFIERWSAERPWRDTTRRYLLTPASYPGIDDLAGARAKRSPD